MDELNKKLDRIIFLLETINNKMDKKTRVNVLPTSPGVPRVKVGRVRSIRPIIW